MWPFARYSYSKTKGLFGGLSVEGSVIVERQDANGLAYNSVVTAKRLLSGSIPPPPWAMDLIHTLERCTGPPGGRSWIQDSSGEQKYVFGGMASPEAENTRRKAISVPSFPPASWGRSKDGGSYFHTDPVDEPDAVFPQPDNPLSVQKDEPSKANFPIRFESDDSTDYIHKSENTHPDIVQPERFRTHSSSKSLSTLPPFHSSSSFPQSQAPFQTNPFISSQDLQNQASSQPQSYPVAQAVAQFDFKAIEV